MKRSIGRPQDLPYGKGRDPSHPGKFPQVHCICLRHPSAFFPMLPGILLSHTDDVKEFPLRSENPFLSHHISASRDAVGAIFFLSEFTPTRLPLAPNFVTFFARHLPVFPPPSCRPPTPLGHFMHFAQLPPIFQTRRIRVHHSQNLTSPSFKNKVPSRSLSVLRPFFP